jgi:fatty acid desaturase
MPNNPKVETKAIASLFHRLVAIYLSNLANIIGLYNSRRLFLILLVRGWFVVTFFLFSHFPILFSTLKMEAEISAET